MRGWISFRALRGSVCQRCVQLAGTLRYLVGLWRREDQAYTEYRHTTARTLLLGLEVLVAADVVRTVAVAPSFGNVAVLACIVAIRTFLGWTLQLEMEGRWPWQRSPSS